MSTSKEPICLNVNLSITVIVQATTPIRDEHMAHYKRRQPKPIPRLSREGRLPPSDLIVESFIE